MDLYQTLIDKALNGSGGGGGGGSLGPIGIIRPDAELVHRWSYDKMAVADEGYTIPAYTTSQQTVISAQSKTVEGIDCTQNCYRVMYKYLITPIYSSDEKFKGRQAYSAKYGVFDSYYWAAGTFHDADKNASSAISTQGIASGYTYIRWDSQTAISNTSSGSGCDFASFSAPAYKGTQHAYKLTMPQVTMKGNESNFSQAAWELLEDIRIQCVWEIYRIPMGTTEYDGWILQPILPSLQEVYDSGGSL